MDIRRCWSNLSRNLVAPSIVGSEFNSDRGNGDLNSDWSWTLREAWSHLALLEIGLTLIVATVTWTLTEVELFKKPGRP